MNEYGDSLERELAFGGGELESPELLLKERYLSVIEDVVKWNDEVSKGEEEGQPTRVRIAEVCMNNEMKEMTKRAEELSDYYVRNRDMQGLSEMIETVEEGLAHHTGVNLWTLVEKVIRCQFDEYQKLVGIGSMKDYAVFLMENNQRWRDLVTHTWIEYRLDGMVDL